MLGVLKKTLKSGLHQFGLLKPSQYVYFNLKTLSPAVLKSELQYRTQKAPDGYALPPAHLIYDVIACRWGHVFLDSGERVVDDMAAILDKNNKPLSGFSDILDFGCGCGRLIRQVHQRTDANLMGSDYNGTLINWCQEHLPFATFNKNELAPPLDIPDASVDYIYARSVFTHLPLDLQIAWMKELHRVLRKGGCIYFTMHGRPLSSGLNEQQLRTFNAGELVVTYSSVAGENLCSTFALSSFVETTLMDGFSMLDFVEGRSAAHLKQDVYLMQKL
ncbi:MAG: class I SAM-dependent methyltransferase [Rhodothermales bacterium]